MNPRLRSGRPAAGREHPRLDVLHHASRNVLPEARRYRPKAYCKEGGVAAEAETSDGLLQLPDAIGLVRQQLVAAQLEGRRVVAGKVATSPLAR